MNATWIRLALAASAAVATAAAVPSPAQPSAPVLTARHLATGAASGSGIPTGAPVLAAGVMTIRVDRAAAMTIRIPRAVTVSGPCLSYSTPGTGLLGMLVPVNVSAGAPLDFGVLPPQLGGRAYSLACSAVDGRVAAGVYNLYVAPMGRPGTLRLVLPGLRGSIAVHPTRRVASTVRLLGNALPAAAAAAHQAWSSMGTLRGRGLAYVAVWGSSALSPSSVIGACVYKGAAPPEVATLPGCPGADYFGAAPYSGHLQPAEDYLASTTGDLPAGDYDFTGFATGLGASATAAALGWWLTY